MKSNSQLRQPDNYHNFTSVELHYYAEKVNDLNKEEGFMTELLTAYP